MTNIRRLRAWWREVLNGITIFGMPLRRDSDDLIGDTILQHLKALPKDW